MSCSDLQSRVFKIEVQVVNDGSQEARNPKSGFEGIGVAGTTLTLPSANSGDERESAPKSSQLVSGGSVATNYDTLGQKRPRKRGEEECVVECGGVGVLEMSETQTLTQGLEARVERHAGLLQSCCHRTLSADRSSPPRQVSQQFLAEASEVDESDGVP